MNGPVSLWSLSLHSKQVGSCDAGVNGVYLTEHAIH